MNEVLNIDGGQTAYGVTGDGPMVVLSHGMGEHRGVYRFLAPLLAQAGYRVANADLRGHGQSSMGWRFSSLWTGRKPLRGKARRLTATSSPAA